MNLIGDQQVLTPTPPPVSSTARNLHL